MRQFFRSFLRTHLLLLALVVVTACSSKKVAELKTDDSTVSTNAVYTPALRPVGKIAHINKIGRFVVINYGLGPTPAIGQTVFVYRNGLKVAELKITGPEEDTITIADIREGDPQFQDDVREH